MLFELMESKPRNPYFNLGLDEAVAICFDEWSQKIKISGGARLWMNRPTIVLGRTDNPNDTVDSQKMSTLSIGGKNNASSPPIYLARRISGGGTVLHTSSALNYSIFLNKDIHPDLRSITKSYGILLDIVKRVLLQQKIKTNPVGQSDLAILCEDGKFRKIAGHAQFRKRSVIVFHGTLILHQDLIQYISKYLAHPPKEPNYRQKRQHTDFLTHLPFSFNLSIFYDSLMRELKQFTGDYHSAPLASEELQSISRLAIQLARERYRKRQWILGEQHLLL